MSEQFNERKNFCKKCILNTNMPGIKINKKTGLCDLCSNFIKNKENRLDDQKEIDSLLKSNSEGEYNLIMAISGGKDSCYTLYKIRELYPKIRILSILVDNGFISEEAKKNAKKMAIHTNSDFKIINIGGEELNNVFKKVSKYDFYPTESLKRASPICITCSNFFKHIIFKEAITKSCFNIAFGWTPGQTNKTIIKLKKEFMLLSKNSFEKVLERISNSKELKRFLPEDELYENLEKGLVLLHPLRIWDYEEKKIISTLKEKIDWKESALSDSNSSNCLLNNFAVENHINRYGFHPYALEIAGLVREGYISREDGFEKLKYEKHSSEIRTIANKIGLKDSSIKYSKNNDLGIDCQIVKDKITLFINQKVRRDYKKKGVVVGVSGGVDSSLVLFLAVKALGAENVFGALLPEKESHNKTTELGELICKKLGVKYNIIDLTSILEKIGLYSEKNKLLKELFVDYNKKEHTTSMVFPNDLLDNQTLTIPLIKFYKNNELIHSKRLTVKHYNKIVSLQNIKQRLRMIYLYKLAEERNYLVLGTTNKTERLLGQFVKYGDGGVDLEPIADLYKTQVYQLCNHFKLSREIIERPASPDTWSYFTSDENFYWRMPLDYLDPLLLYWQQMKSAEEISKKIGIASDKVRRILDHFDRIKRSTFHFMESPQIWKIS